jgi:hypothetical protein
MSLRPRVKGWRDSEPNGPQLNSMRSLMRRNQHAAITNPSLIVACDEATGRNGRNSEQMEARSRRDDHPSQ